MIREILVVAFHILAVNRVGADGNSSRWDHFYAPDVVSDFHPSLAVIVGFLAFLFFAAFFILFFAKCIRRSSRAESPNFPEFARSASRFSGLDRTVVESLPFFRFSALKGAREGLECAVCLSKFEDVEILRLLPKCKHAFHISCVDEWLEGHSTCPLCRCIVSPHDPGMSDAREELYIQREASPRSSSRFSFRKLFRPEFHKYNHKITAAGLVFKNRWSNVSSSDLIALRAEMLNDASTSMFAKNRSDLQMKRTSESSDGEGVRRALSDISFARSRSMRDVKAEGSRRMWITVVGRTLQWFAHRDARTAETSLTCPWRAPHAKQSPAFPSPPHDNIIVNLCTEKKFTGRCDIIAHRKFLGAEVM